MTYKTDLDYNLIDKPNLTDEELLKYIEENFFDKSLTKWSLKNIYVFLQILCKLEKVEPSVEQLIYILCNHKRLLNEACAGAGKTTMSKYKMAIANQCYGIRGADILAIAYNTHAAEDVKQKYTSLARKLNKKAACILTISDSNIRNVGIW